MQKERQQLELQFEGLNFKLTRTFLSYCLLNSLDFKVVNRLIKLKLEVFQPFTRQGDSFRCTFKHVTPRLQLLYD